MRPAVEQRTEQALSLRLGERLLRVFEYARYRQGWIERDPAWNTGLILNETVSEPPTPGLDGSRTVEFDASGKRYCIEVETHLSYDVNYGHLTLREAVGNELFTARFHGRNSSSCQVYSVEAFRPGPWVAEFLEISERLSALHRERELHAERQKVRRQIEQFGLDDESIARAREVLDRDKERTATPAASLGRRVGLMMQQCRQWFRGA